MEKQIPKEFYEKNMFLNILQYSQRNTSVGVIFW